MIKVIKTIVNNTTHKNTSLYKWKIIYVKKELCLLLKHIKINSNINKIYNINQIKYHLKSQITSISVNSNNSNHKILLTLSNRYKVLKFNKNNNAKNNKM